jgi:hypothetical protein
MRTQYGATRLAHASPSGREQVPCARRIGEQTGEQPAVWLVLHGFAAPVELAWYLRRVSRADLRQLAPETWPGGPRRRGQEVRHTAAAWQRGQQRRQVEPGRMPPDKQQPSPGTGPADRRPPRAAGDQRRLRPPRLRPACTSCAQDSQICTAFVLIGAKPTSAQIGGSVATESQVLNHPPRHAGRRRLAGNGRRARWVVSTSRPVTSARALRGDRAATAQAGASPQAFPGQPAMLAAARAASVAA